MPTEPPSEAAMSDYEVACQMGDETAKAAALTRWRAATANAQPQPTSWTALLADPTQQLDMYGEVAKFIWRPEDAQRVTLPSQQETGRD